MTVPLTCSFCGRQETRRTPGMFLGWWCISPDRTFSWRAQVCSLECMASWAMRRQVGREAAMQATDERC